MSSITSETKPGKDFDSARNSRPIEMPIQQQQQEPKWLADLKQKQQQQQQQQM